MSTVYRYVMPQIPELPFGKLSPLETAYLADLMRRSIAAGIANHAAADALGIKLEDEHGDPDGALVPLPDRPPAERVVPPLPLATYRIMTQ